MYTDSDDNPHFVSGVSDWDDEDLKLRYSTIEGAKGGEDEDGSSYMNYRLVAGLS